jgi:hypothetical protein
MPSGATRISTRVCLCCLLIAAQRAAVCIILVCFNLANSVREINDERPSQSKLALHLSLQHWLLQAKPRRRTTSHHRNPPRNRARERPPTSATRTTTQKTTPTPTHPRPSLHRLHLQAPVPRRLHITELYIHTSRDERAQSHHRLGGTPQVQGASEAPTDDAELESDALRLAYRLAGLG